MVYVLLMLYYLLALLELSVLVVTPRYYDYK